ncbi:MAG TPA: bifunctional riboflavin kinase/FAD synthetase [Mycobacteriales bacterium]|nr:bifunctional riboflavin kinase/FAD synthetase [Mycobacteriales bacterium]
MSGGRRTVVPIGIFDGVHRGHQLVLTRAHEAARAADADVAVVTFDPHPVAILRPELMPMMLTTTARRVALLERYGADRVLVLEFSHEMSLQSPEDFIETTLVGQLGAVRVVVGENFRFGHGAKGDVDLLRRSGLEVDALPLVSEGEPISSTRIRAQVAAGDVVGAAGLLGRAHLVEGPVIRGDARGRALGFPTANVDVAEGIAIPADGVYAGHLTGLSGDRMPAAISVGTNPTFDGQNRRVEAYAIDVGHDLDLYGRHVTVEFTARLRGMERFESVESLVSQMAADVDTARSRLH